MKVDFPISIALIGAPGSGKRALAEEFQRISKDWFAESHSICSCAKDANAGCSYCGNPLWIIENSGTVIERDFDQAMGLFGGPTETLQAFFNRSERESVARKVGASFVTLGTVIDNLAHAGVGLENIMTGLQTPDAQLRLQQGQMAMGSLTFMFRERFQYVFAFYVPHPGTTIVLPGQDEGEGNYNQRVDMALRAIFSNFGLRIQMLDQPSIEEKAATIFETVKRIMENGPELPPAPEAEEPVAIESGDVPPVSEPTITE